MAAPTIDSSQKSDVTNGTSLTMTMPATITSGDTLIMIAGVRAQDLSTTVTGTVTGWTNIANADTGAFSAGTKTDQAVWWLKADGTEDGSTCVVGWGGSSANASGIVYRITDAEDPSTAAPEADSDALDSDSTTKSPPDLIPTGGSQNYLWILAFFHRTDGTVSAYPYADNNDTAGGSGVSNLSGYCTTRSTVAASSLTPGDFTTSLSADWSAVTVAVYPVGGGGGGDSFAPISRLKYKFIHNLVR